MQCMFIVNQAGFPNFDKYFCNFHDMSISFPVIYDDFNHLISLLLFVIVFRYFIEFNEWSIFYPKKYVNILFY